MSARRHALSTSFCVILAGLAGCEPTPDPNTSLDPTVGTDLPPPPEAPVEGENVAQDLPPPPAATMEVAEEVETLENRLRMLDEDGDGFVDRDEAESFYRWRFDELDDNGDGRLARAELELEYADVPEAEVAIEELVGATEDEYTEAELEKYHLRADRTTGMMSTADFDELVGTTDVGDLRP